MLFRIFMLLMDLLIPITMLILGKRFLKHPPAEITPYTDTAPPCP